MDDFAAFWFTRGSIFDWLTHLTLWTRPIVSSPCIFIYVFKVKTASMGVHPFLTGVVTKPSFASSGKRTTWLKNEGIRYVQNDDSCNRTLTLFLFGSTTINCLFVFRLRFGTNLTYAYKRQCNISNQTCPQV